MLWQIISARFLYLRTSFTFSTRSVPEQFVTFWSLQLCWMFAGGLWLFDVVGFFFIFLNDKNDKKQEDLLISSHGLHLLSSGHTGGPSAHVYIHHSGIQCCQQCVGLWKHFHYPFLIKLQSHMPFSYRITSADCNYLIISWE